VTLSMPPAPCDWAILYDPACGPGETLESLAPSGVALYEEMAVDYLWNWTGQQFGTCQVAYRPCRQNCGSTTGGRFTPALIGGQWYNLACGSCGDTCGCGFTSTLRLPPPVVSVDEVRIDGTVLDAAAYELQGRYLVRTDGGRWPTCQDLGAPTTEAGTWEITFTAGTPVPVGGQLAAGRLTQELAKAACGDSTCQLPRRLQSLTRQGVAIVMDTFDDLAKGGTGIWLIDSWVASVTKAPTRSRVYSPDVSRRAPIRRV